MPSVTVKFPIVIYPSEDTEGGRFTAHCLNMDILADDDTVEGAVSKLVESIEAGLEASAKHGASPFRDAPAEYWQKLGRAEALAPELRERIIRSANKRIRKSGPSAIDVEHDCDLRQLDELQVA